MLGWRGGPDHITRALGSDVAQLLPIGQPRARNRHPLVSGADRAPIRLGQHVIAPRPDRCPLVNQDLGFRVLNSEIEIGPIYHRLPDRIRAHAMICFIALIIYRVMRSRLHAGGTSDSPERALAKLRRIQRHRVTLNDSQPIAGLSSIDQEQVNILAALTIKKPTLGTQLTLL